MSSPLGVLADLAPLAASLYRVYVDAAGGEVRGVRLPDVDFTTASEEPVTEHLRRHWSGLAFEHWRSAELAHYAAAAQGLLEARDLVDDGAGGLARHPARTTILQWLSGHQLRLAWAASMGPLDEALADLPSAEDLERFAAATGAEVDRLRGSLAP